MLENIKKGDSVISKSGRAIKLEEFDKLKERIAKITRKGELTQAEFESYIKPLGAEEACKYCMGIRNVLNLCNNNLFKCEFRSQDKYHIKHGSKFECRRARMLKLKSLL